MLERSRVSWMSRDAAIAPDGTARRFRGSPHGPRTQRVPRRTVDLRSERLVRRCGLAARTLLFLAAVVARRASIAVDRRRCQRCRPTLHLRTRRHRTTDHRGIDRGRRRFAWRPDGAAIAFVRSDPVPQRTGAAAYADAFRSDRQRLSRDGAAAAAPSVASEVARRRTAPDRRSVERRRLDASRGRRMARNSGTCARPTRSTAYPTAPTAYALDLRTWRSRALTPHDAHEDQIEWSPAGSTLVLSLFRATAIRQIGHHGDGRRRRRMKRDASSPTRPARRYRRVDARRTRAASQGVRRNVGSAVCARRTRHAA